MTDSHKIDYSKKKLEARVQYLEEVNRSTFEGLDLMVTLGGSLTRGPLERKPKDIFKEAVLNIRRLVEFDVLVFMLVNKRDPDFSMRYCDPPKQRKMTRKEIDAQIDDGTFAWALKQTRAVIVKSKIFEGKKIVFHTLSTKSQILGMFLGVLNDEEFHVDGISSDLLSLITYHCAQDIENNELYDQLKKSSEELKTTNEQLLLEINERKQAERMLHIKNDAIESSINAIVITDMDLNLTYVNQAFMKTWGYRQINDVLGCHVDKFWPKNEDAHEIFSNLEKRKRWFGQFEGKRKNGDLFPIEIAAVVVMGENKEPICMMASMIDITDKLSAEQRRRKLEHQLMQESRLSSIGLLTSGIAHNLRGPLSALMGHINLFQLQYPDIDDLDKILKLAKNINDIIDTMMTKSRKSQNKNESDIDISEMLKNELDFLEADLDFKHYVTKEYNLCDDMPNIRGVYSDFSQGVMNIIHNAIQSMEKSDEKKLTVKTCCNKEYIYITVTDTGCGIAKKNQSKLFSPFFTTKDARMNSEGVLRGGTGLGLYSAYQLLSPYGATFDVKSKVREGTTFIIKIPLRKNATSHLNS